MPTYEFRCPDGTIIERIFKISEVPSEIPSPSGDGMAIRIISGGAALLFKGSGFYITDYGKDGKKDQRAASGDKSSSGTESTPAADKSTSDKSTSDKSTSDKSASDKPAADRPAASPPPSTKSD